MSKKIGLAFVTLLLSATMAWGFPAGPAGNDGPGRGQRPPRVMGAEPGALPLLALDLLDLTTEQQAAITALFKKEVAMLSLREEEQQRQFTALRDGVLHGDVDAVRSLVRTNSDDREEQLVAIAEFMYAFRAILTASQCQRLDVALSRMQQGFAGEHAQRQEHGADMHPGGRHDDSVMAPPREFPLVQLRMMLQQWLHQNNG